MVYNIVIRHPHFGPWVCIINNILRYGFIERIKSELDNPLLPFLILKELFMNPIITVNEPIDVEVTFYQTKNHQSKVVPRAFFLRAPPTITG